jgi:hypothetical protein
MPQKYQLATDSAINEAAKAGTVVYDCVKCDYGCASDDSYYKKEHHTSITLDSTGDYPFFTHPTKDLIKIKE